MEQYHCLPVMRQHLHVISDLPFVLVICFWYSCLQSGN